jgi:hypothetical protein
MQTCNCCLFKDIVLLLENGHTKYCAQKPTSSRKTKSLVWGPGVHKASPCLKQGILVGYRDFTFLKDMEKIRQEISFSASEDHGLINFIDIKANFVI